MTSRVNRDYMGALSEMDQGYQCGQYSFGIERRSNGKSARPRLLLLSPRWSFINKTESYFFDSLSNYFETIRYGPGYLDVDDIEMSIFDVLKEVGRVDVIIINELLLFGWLSPEMYESQRKINKFYFNLKKYVYTKSNFPVDLDKLEIPLFVSLLRWDYYHCTQEQIETLENLNTNNNAYYVCWGKDFILPKEELPDLERERFFPYANNNFANFVRRREERVIPLPHMVDESEMLKLGRKHHEWCIPGAKYYHREMIKDYFKANQMNYVTVTPINFIFRILERLKIAYSTRYDFTMNLSYNSFSAMINKSWCSYTCGSALRWPVRKFFEIPAFASLLVCHPCAGFEKLGFVNGENCFATDVNNLDGIVEKTRDKELVREMIIKGQEMIKARHTAQVRARQFFNLYTIIREDNFGNAYWEDGNIFCRTRDGKIRVV